MIKEISINQLEQLVKSGAVLVDVREQEEVLAGMIAMSKHWPLSTFGIRKDEISQAHPTIFYCRSGVRSQKAAEFASQWTDQALYSLRGGYLLYCEEHQT